MRPQIKQIDTSLEVYLDTTCILTIDRSFAKSELLSWDVASRDEFLERFWPLEERYALRVGLMKLSKKAMHSRELDACLEERHFSANARQRAIDELVRLNVLNDEDFEAYFVKKLQKQGKSRHQITIKAKMRGIPLKSLDAHLGPDVDTLKALVEKRYPILLDKTAPKAQKEKAIAALYRRGFSVSCILKEFI
ncbi:MAG: RecX family transcriptional regulator, partial [Chlamydiales bacterium]|nr:RecX family transcriptional regulator [Chlamydiales bacterium]